MTARDGQRNDHPSGAGGSDDTNRAFRALLRRFLLLTLLLILGLGAVMLLFREPFNALSCWFVAQLGGWGVLATFFLADALPVPLWHDGVSALALRGGVSFWEVVAMGCVGTLFGSTFGFWIGRNLSHLGWVERRLARRGAEAAALAARYGKTALVVGALTPVNYCMVLWTAGAVGVTWRQFFSVAWLRFFRVVFYTWLIDAGVGLFDMQYLAEEICVP